MGTAARGRAALFFGPGRDLEITELPVPAPEPGAVVVRVTRANICGSDLHIWRGDGWLGAMAREDGRIIGHEMTGVVHALGEGVTTDWAGRPLAAGDRVAYQYFAPCGRCRSCLRGMTEACARSFKVLQGPPAAFPHFRGRTPTTSMSRPGWRCSRCPTASATRWWRASTARWRRSSTASTGSASGWATGS